MPSLDKRQAAAFLARFAPDHRIRGGKATGMSVYGQTFSIDLEHGGGMRPDIVGAALRYMGVSREDFFIWLSGSSSR